MAERTPDRTRPRTSSRRGGNGATGFSADERAAMRERARELKAAAAKEDGEQLLLAAIAKMDEPDRSIATRVHALVKAAAPELEARTWYGMPAYARGGNVVCFFQNAGKFKARYQVLGFNDRAQLDDGAMWPISYAILELGPAEEARVTALVQQAVGAGQARG